MGFSQVQGGATTEVVYQYNANGDLTSDGLRTYSLRRARAASAVTTGASDTSPTTRYAHNALGQRVFKTEAIYPPAQGDENDPGFMQGLSGFFSKALGSPTLDRCGAAGLRVRLRRGGNADRGDGHRAAPTAPGARSTSTCPRQAGRCRWRRS